MLLSGLAAGNEVYANKEKFVGKPKMRPFVISMGTN
jgi:hypothetical protein